LKRLIAIFILLPLLVAAKGKGECYVHPDYPFRSVSQFEFHHEEFDPFIFINPLVPKPRGADMLSALNYVAYEMEFRNIRYIDAHAHGILTLYVYQIGSDVKEPSYSSTAFSYKKLGDLPRGAWVIDGINEDRNELVFRSWGLPNAKEKDSAKALRDLIAERMACFPKQ
jgi:hypothetical protein